MINFKPQNVLDYPLTLLHKQWLKQVIRREGLIPGDISYQFCTDEELLIYNKQFLNHDTFTDIITFDNRLGDMVSGNIIISVDRVGENAVKFNAPLEDELLRVIVHGVLHLCGYADKSESDAAEMRRKENEALQMFHSMNF